MVTFDQSLLGLVQEGRVTVEAAMKAVSSQHDFTLAMQQAGLEAPPIRLNGPLGLGPAIATARSRDERSPSAGPRRPRCQTSTFPVIRSSRVPPGVAIVSLCVPVIQKAVRPSTWTTS